MYHDNALYKCTFYLLTNSDKLTSLRKLVSGDTEVADHLIESLDAARCRRWEETTEQMNFTKSSRKSWLLIRHLGAAQTPPRTSHPPVKADAVASHLLQVARAPVNKKHKRR